MGRYVIYGAGAIGAVLGGLLALAGRDVVLVARGAHGEAMAREGLRLGSNAGEQVIRLPVVADISAANPGQDDIVVLAMKTQDAFKAMEELVVIAGPGVPIFCAQNGLESERAALRLFENVYGVLVFCSGASLEPGVASYYHYPQAGVLDVGRFPGGVDAVAEAVAADFRLAGFDSVAQPDIMRWKRGKLITNMVNPISAACERPEAARDIVSAAQAEAEAAMRAAGLDFATQEELKARAAGLRTATVEGRPFPGGSTFQSLARGARATEADYLAGEVVLLGRLTGTPTPVNAGLQRLIRGMAQAGAPPRSMSPEALREAVMPSAPV